MSSFASSWNFSHPAKRNKCTCELIQREGEAILSNWCGSDSPYLGLGANFTAKAFGDLGHFAYVAWSVKCAIPDSFHRERQAGMIYGTRAPHI
jgi:hypothetical protein